MEWLRYLILEREMSIQNARFAILYPLLVILSSIKKFLKKHHFFHWRNRRTEPHVSPTIFNTWSSTNMTTPLRHNTNSIRPRYFHPGRRLASCHLLPLHVLLEGFLRWQFRPGCGNSSSGEQATEQAGSFIYGWDSGISTISPRVGQAKAN